MWLKRLIPPAYGLELPIHISATYIPQVVGLTPILTISKNLSSTGNRIGAATPSMSSKYHALNAVIIGSGLTKVISLNVIRYVMIYGVDVCADRFDLILFLVKILVSLVEI